MYETKIPIILNNDNNNNNFTNNHNNNNFNNNNNLICLPLHLLPLVLIIKFLLHIFNKLYSSKMKTYAMI